jgi:hypothetical protein
VRQASRKWIIGGLVVAATGVAVASTHSPAAAVELTKLRSAHCNPKDGMPITGCIPGEAERVRATKEWRIDPGMIAWVR